MSDAGSGTGADAGEAAGVPAGWEGILEPGERILWQGRPDPSFRLEPSHVVVAVAGAGFLCFVLWLFLPAALAGRGAWSLVLLPSVLILGIVAAGPLATMLRRRGTWYTLTDRRAIVATRLPVLGRDLQSYRIRANSPIRWDGGEPGTVWFAERIERTGDESREVPVGFERIAGATEVHALLKRIGRGGGGGAGPDGDRE